jgi:Atypical Arm repeat
LLSEDTDLASFACEALTSILALGQDHVETVIQHQMIPALVELLIVDNVDIFIPAMNAIRAVVSHGTADQIRVLVDHGCIGPMCDFLTYDPAEYLYPDIVKALDVLGSILRAGAGRRGANPAADEVVEEGGLENLRELRQHHHPQVRAGAIAILHTYFGDHDDDDDEESGAGSESDASGDEDDGEEESSRAVSWAPSDASGEADGDDDGGEEPPLQRPRMV